jgi:hypothetical protein
MSSGSMGRCNSSTPICWALTDFVGGCERRRGKYESDSRSRTTANFSYANGSRRLRSSSRTVNIEGNPVRKRRRTNNQQRQFSHNARNATCTESIEQSRLRLSRIQQQLNVTTRNILVFRHFIPRLIPSPFLILAFVHFGF